MGKEELTVVVSAKDNTKGVFKTLKQRLGGIGEMALGVATGTILAKIPDLAMDAGRAIGDMVMEAAKVNDARLAFQGFGGDIKDLRAGTLGMVADAELMYIYNDAAQLVGKTFANQLPDAMQYLNKIAASTGEDVGFLLDSLTKGVGRLSPMILDNLKIQVSLADATARAAEMFGVEEDALTKAQIQAGMMEVTLEKLAANTADLPDINDSLTTSINRIKASFTNVKDTVGGALLPVLSDLAKKFADFVQRHGPQLQAIIKDAGAQFTVWVKDILPKVVHWFKNELIPWIQDKFIPAAKEIVAWIKDEFIPWVRDKLIPAIKDFIAWITNTYESFMKMKVKLSTTLSQLKYIFSHIWEYIAKKVGERIDQIKNTVMKVWGALTGWLDRTVKGIADDLRNAFENARQWVIEKVVAIILGIRKLWEDAREGGRNLVEGLRQGINNAWTSFKNWVLGLLSGLRDAVLGFFGIHSPSSMFAEIGQQLMAGLEQGIGGGLTMPINAMYQAGGAVAGAAMGGANQYMNVYGGLHLNGVQNQQGLLAELQGMMP